MIATSGTLNSLSDGSSCTHFARLAALGEHQHDVAGVDAAQVAVKRFGRVQEVGPRAERSERGGDLLTDDSRLAHAGDDHAALAFVQQPHRLAKRFFQPIRKLPQSPCLRGAGFPARRGAAPRP